MQTIIFNNGKGLSRSNKLAVVEVIKETKTQYTVKAVSEIHNLRFSSDTPRTYQFDFVIKKKDIIYSVDGNQLDIVKMRSRFNSYPRYPFWAKGKN